MVDDELKAVFEIANVAIEVVVMCPYGCRWAMLLLRLDNGCSRDAGVEVEVLHELQWSLKTPYLIVNVERM